MKRTLVGAVLCLAALGAAAQPNLILVNGKVWTGDRAKPWVDAVAIKGDTITDVGTNAEIRAKMGPDTKVLDAQGRLVIPGINDAHMHPSSGMPSFGISNELDATWADISAALSSGLEETPKDLWITGTLGPALMNDASITAAKIDAVAPGRKVILTSFTGHGAVLSTAAMRAFGLDPKATDPPGGWYGRDENGNLNGRVFEYAQYAVDRQFADMASDEELAAAVQALNDEAVRYGITTVQAMPMTSEAQYERAVRGTGIPLRVRLISFPSNIANKPWLQKNGAIKFILDGTPIERGAALRGETKYAAGGQGRENFSDLAPLVKIAVDNNQQLLVHAGGDRTIASALSAIAAARLNRARIEHADGLLPDLFPLMKQTGAVAVLNPTHFPFRNHYPKGAYMPALSLVKAGIPIAIGSDGPLNPYLNIMHAVARTDQPNESLSRDDALRAYTTGAAYAEMTENTKGKIAPGYLADIAVLSQNIFTVDAAALPETRSVLTIIGGKVVHQE